MLNPPLKKALAATAAAVLMLSACGQERELPAGGTQGMDEAGCRALLGGPAVEELTGEQDSHRMHEVGSLSGCQALTASSNGMRITVVQVPGSQWAESQERTFSDLLPDGDPAITELTEKLGSGELTDEEGCRLFDALAAATHKTDGPVVVGIAPLGALSQASAQACVDGEFGLVAMERMSKYDLTADLEELLTHALDEVHPAELA